MAIDRNKVLEAAQQLVEKGSYDKAIAEYQRLVHEDPRDVRAWLKIGDLQTKTGNVPAAVETYAKVGEFYAKQGVHLKAVAVYKQIVKLDPERLEAYHKLAETYEQLGLSNEARATYDQVASVHLREGRALEAIPALQRATEIDPEDVQARIKLAEALSRAGKREEAAEEFEKSGALLKMQGLMDDYLKVAERLLFHRQDDAKLARDLAHEYLERGDAKRALGRLQLCFKTDPRDVVTLELLARAFQSLGQSSKAVSVHREVAKIHEEAGRAEQHLAAMKAILALDPTDEIAKEIVEKAKRVPTRTPLEEALEVSASSPPEDAEPELEMLDDDVEEEIELEEEPEMELVMLDEDETIELDEEPKDPLTEARSFARLGLWPRVLEAAERIVEGNEDDIDARLLLADAYREMGQTDDAVEQLLAVAEYYSFDEPERSVDYLRQVLFLDPENVEAKLQLKGSSPGALEALGEAAHTELDDAFSAHDRDTSPPPAAEAAPSFDTVPPPEAAPSFDTVPPPEAPAASPDTTPPEAAAQIDDSGEFAAEGRVSFGDLEVDVDLLEPISPDEFEALPVDDSQTEPAVAEHADATDLEEELEEAEFYLNQGLFEEARETLNDALEEHPDHPLLLDRLAEIDALEHEAAEATAAAPPAEESVDDAFAMAERLAGDLSSDPLMSGDMLDADVVFEQFKKGVAEAVGDEDSATHFDLGIAYREMGLFDDAVREFEVAGRAPSRTCNAYSMAGMCHLEAGRFGNAIEAFRVALDAPEKAPGEELGLYYELGNALELFGDDDQALAAFKRVAELDPSFRDVKARIDALGDVDAAFDDIFGGD